MVQQPTCSDADKSSSEYRVASETIKEVVTATLELESYLTPSKGPGRVAQVGVEEPDMHEAMVAAVMSKKDVMLDLMVKFMDPLEKLEANEPNLVGDLTADRQTTY